MNTHTSTFLILTALLTQFPRLTVAETLSLPAGNLTVTSSPLPYTAEELAVPPAGEIKKMYLREINSCGVELEQVINGVPSDQRSEPGFSLLQSVKTTLDTLASSRRQSDLFSLVAAAAQVFEASEAESVSEFVQQGKYAIENLNVPLIESIASYVVERNGMAEPTHLASFIRVFATRGFLLEPDWESGPSPIDAAGVMLLDATAVVNQLKTRPWEEAKRFLGGTNDANSYFARYGSTGDGLAVLKTKYAQSKAAADAKFVELKNWVAQQEAAAGVP